MVAAVLGIGMAMKPETAKAETVAVAACDSVVDALLCVRVEGNQIVVVNLLTGLVVLRQPIPRVTVGGPTIRVTLPRVVVTQAPVTITLPRVTLPQVTLPGQRVTTTVKLPGATETVRLPGQTVTLPPGVKTVIQPSPGSTQTLPVAIVTARGANGQTIQTSVTITPSPLPGTVTTKPGVERKVRVSVPTFVGLSLGLLLLGLILGLLAIYVAYAAGYKDSEAAEKATWNKFRSDLFGKK